MFTEKINVDSSSVPVLMITVGNESVCVNGKVLKVDGELVELDNSKDVVSNEGEFVVETRSEFAPEDGVKVGGSR